MKLNKDGLARDIDRLGIEFKAIRSHLKPEISRFSWKEPWQWFHLSTNIFVESCEASPYFMGHAIMVSLVSLIAGVVLWVL